MTLPETFVSDFVDGGAGLFFGFVHDTARPARRFAVEVLVDGRPVTLVRADRFNRWLSDAGYGDGCHGFVFTLDEGLAARRIEARLANSGERLGEPIDLARDRPDPTVRAILHGEVRWCGGLRLVGWTMDRRGRRQPGQERPPTVLVREDTTVVCEARPRDWDHADGAEGFAAGRLAFDLMLPAALADGRPHRLDVVDETGVALAGSPVLVLAWPDGLRAHLERETWFDPADPRVAAFDRLFPGSLPLHAYGDWRAGLAGPGDAGPAAGAVAVLVLGDHEADATIASLERQSHVEWIALGIETDASRVAFRPEDLAAAMGDVPADVVAVLVVLAGTVLDPEALGRIARAFDGTALQVLHADVEVPDGSEAGLPAIFGTFDRDRLLEQGAGAYLFAVRPHLLARCTGDVGDVYRLMLALVGDDTTGSAGIGHLPGPVARLPLPLPPEAGTRLAEAAVADLAGRGIAATAEVSDGGPFPSVRVRRTLNPGADCVFVVTFGDDPAPFQTCLTSLAATAGAGPGDIAVIDAGQSTPARTALLRTLAEAGSRVIRPESVGSWSEAANGAAEDVTASVICFVDDSIEFLEGGWLEELRSRLAEADAAVAGGKLLGPDGRVRDGGLVLRAGQWPEPAFVGEPGTAPGYLGMLAVARETSTIGRDLMLVRRTDFAAIGGFDAGTFPGPLAEVDLCLRLRAAGRRILWTPHLAVRHRGHTSAVNVIPNDPHTPETRALGRLAELWSGVLAEDPCYSPVMARSGPPWSALAWPPPSCDIRTAAPPRERSFRR